MRVLVVEDEPKIAAFLKRGLEENAYAVDVARDGEEGLAWAQAFPYDLIILDIMLPKLDGVTLCRRLRAEGNRANILMLTAKDDIEDRVAGLDAGADDYLVKPFAFRELLARLRALQRRGGEQRTTRLQVADLVLDLVSHQAMRGGRTIELTAKEFALLEFLMRHPNQTLSRTVIAEHVWDYDFYNQSNVVDVYIRYLRKKIDDPFNLKLIQTVRGMGYRLTDANHD
ncbi:two-component system response regulator RppA [Caldilinea sp.]|uniref:two-component system response regulator RppA n=1 Tax=Caldilinea sp. TaxID=2293560 RepID=UPI0027E4D086|nr:two-component system response regulator RppA [Caldilinea sp.]